MNAWVKPASAPCGLSLDRMKAVKYGSFQPGGNTSDPLKLALERFFDEAIKTRKVFGLHVDGIEITQATQYYHAEDHLSDRADRGPDNSIPLIAGKSALVRVYLRNRLGPLYGVTGSLKIERLSWRPGSATLATLMPLAPGTTAAKPDPSYNSERGNLSASLNFRIPASLVGYRLRLTASVRSADGTETDEMSIDVEATLRQTLRIRGIAISYQGPDASGNNQLTLARPAVADFVSTASMALAMFPVEDQPDITLTGDFNWFAPMIGAPDPANPGGCAPSWGGLLFWLNLMKKADGNRTDRIYYGLLPAAIPIGFNSGCGGQGGVGAGLVGDTAAFAHECGHVLGFGHAPCGLTTGDPNDPNYPAYEPYDTPAAKSASIGEYGVDLRNNAVVSPASTSDFMSYCGPGWIGPYHYRSLIGHTLLDPRRLLERGPRVPDLANETLFPELDLPRPPGPVELERPLQRYRSTPAQRLILVSGVMQAGRFEQLSVLRLPSRPGYAGAAIPGVAVEVLNGQGAIVDRVRLRRVPLFASGCGCGCGHGGIGPEPGFESGLVEAVLAERDDLAEIRILRDEDVLWSRRDDRDPPRFDSVDAAIREDQLHVRWAITGASGDTHYIIRWSRDGGRDWEALTVVPGTIPGHERPSEAHVTLGALRPGAVLVQVIAVEDLHTVMSEPVPVDIPERPPSVAIIWPREGSVVFDSEPVRLWGMAVSASGERLPSEVLRWTLDGRSAGEGSAVEAELGDWEGEHHATLTARTAHGTAEARVTFLATCSGEPMRRYNAR